jgi:hypothetical protein
VYTETGNADTTTALYQVSGFGQVNFKNLHLTAETASTQSYAISVANVGNTTVNIDNVSMTNGAGSWLTHKVLQNVLHSTNWSADTNGHFGHYDDNTLTTAGITVPVDSTTTAPFAAGTGTNTSGMSWSAGGGRASGGYDGSKGLTVVQSSSGNGVGFYVNAAFLTGLAGGVVRGGTPFWVMGTAIASAATIAPANGVVHVTGTTQINTITAPSGCLSGYACLVRLIPDGLWTTGTSGNIALATTAVVNRPLDLTYDQATLKWYPSY